MEKAMFEEEDAWKDRAESDGVLRRTVFGFEVRWDEQSMKDEGKEGVMEKEDMEVEGK